MPDIGVVYLWRRCEGPDPVRRFVRSLTSHAAGSPCEHFVILKGFGAAETCSALTVFASLRAQPILLPDTNFDIGAYLLAARQVNNRRLLFLNTSSEILADNWLGHFNRALSRKGVGLVGATGSWRSILSARYPRGLRLSNLYRMAHFCRDARRYPPFPNPHIRSNAFMIDRDCFLSLAQPDLPDKETTFAFESGYDGMTRKIAAMGLATLVVDRHGAIFAAADWEAAHVFYSGDQEALLIGDKTTAGYQAASPEVRARLHEATWCDPAKQTERRRYRRP